MSAPSPPSPCSADLVPRIIVVGGSIAGVTAAGTLRAEGYAGEVVVVAEEEGSPYSRVPLSKGVIAGVQPTSSTALPPLPDDVELRSGTRAVALHPERHLLDLADGTSLGYDGLVVATGARARRLAAAGQRGELVVRTLADAQTIASRIVRARSAVVVGAGFLGMEVASTLHDQGLTVTVIDREPPLSRVLGPWLADVLVATATEHGIRLVHAPDGVELVGDPVRAVAYGASDLLEADVVVSAVGDLPNVEWLMSSGLPLAGGLAVDEFCRVTPTITAAGDVTVQETSPGTFRRTPHWTNAVVQGQAAARSLLDPSAAPCTTDHYFWTEQFGINLKIAGALPVPGRPEVIAGNLDDRSALLQWRRDGAPVAAAALNHRVSVIKLKALANG